MARVGVGYFLILLCLAWSVPAAAQDIASGSFAGVVRDTSGAVLPGVTVEVASPALIEKVRSTTTDSDGRYRITGLRPGLYSVTFTLPGFRTVRREGVDLTTGFVATVNGDLSVGAVEETITVTGTAPIVDMKSSTQQQVFSGEVLRELPTGKNSGLYAALLPGAVLNNLGSIDVGGTKGETENNMAIHGGRTLDGLTFRDGNYDGQMFGSRGANAISSINPATIQEVTLQLTGGLTAEAQSGGVQTNAVMRDGGNVLTGTVIVDYGSRHFQADNIDDTLQSRGVKTAAFVKSNRDVAVGVGGPIKRDKLWFFADARQWESFAQFPGIYYNKLQGSLFYEPDLGRPGYSGPRTTAPGLRLTWQASQKNKFTGSFRYERTCNCYFQLLQGTMAPEAAQHDRYRVHIGQVSWTNPVSNRLLLQAGVLSNWGVFFRDTTEDQGVNAGATISVLDRLRNLRYNAPVSLNYTPYQQTNGTASLSYITGSHAFKVGGFYMRAQREQTAKTTSPALSYTFAGRVPESVTYFAYPNLVKNGIDQAAFYVQDQWTIQNLTLNAGLRFDVLSGFAPDTQSPAGPWVPERNHPAVRGIVSWKDVNPRLGAAYNLFGNDRTAIKVNLGRFITFEPLGGLAASTVPANLIVTSANRTWVDANGDYVPQERELGPLSNANFGKVVSNTAYADDLVHGWGKHFYNWQGSVSVQHELRRGFGVNVGYFRTWYGNFTATDNVLVSPSDYDSYCLTSPSDSRLPGGGGQQMCGLMAIKPTSFGRVSNLLAPASDYGKQTEIYTGLDVTVNARFGNGGLVSGGLSTSQTATDNCEVLAKLPEMAPTAAPSRFCHVAPPWSAGTQVKLFGSYGLPWDLRASVVYQNMAGPPTTASFVATNALVTPALGRPLAGGANTTATVELVEPNSLYVEDRINQVNVSLSRTFRFGKARLNPTVDFHNAFNANTVLGVNTRYGPSWQNVTNVFPPRMIKFGVRADF